jgi:hypothetical protein
MSDCSSVANSRYGSETVPENMIGCWERLYISFRDGSEDRSTRVVWLQTLFGVGDIRIASSRPNLRGRRGLADCSKDELLKLAEQDCFCGVTLFDPDAEPFPTASWPKEAYLFRFQPLITFPEPGWIEWQNAATCMIERAPSGAYEEDWRLQPGSRSFAVHLTERDAPTMTCLFVAGEHAIYARNRAAADLPSDKTLLELARDAEYDSDRLRQLVDCEFSYARRAQPDGDYHIELSTLPWREGQPLGCAWIEDVVLNATHREDFVLGDKWIVESLWRP